MNALNYVGSIACAVIGICLVLILLGCVAAFLQGNDNEE